MEAITVNCFTRRTALAGLAGLATIPVLARTSAAQADFREWAPTPPMGWNSWDSFGPTIREADARDVAAIMAQRLLPHGYDVFTVDIQWYEPGANSFDYRKGATLTMDEWGRLIPAPNRFPSAAGSAGFKPIGDYLHGLGSKFGIHIMRGIPRQAVERNTLVLRTKARAAEIANRASVCAWNGDMYGVDMSKPGAQAYYDSLARLYASWGVDFIKADDMSRPYGEHQAEIHALRAAIDRCGRKIVLSLSPGETPLGSAEDVRRQANLWRISDDFWDKWSLLLEQFERLAHWTPYCGNGTWPDADMLPLGLIDLGKRRTNFTSDEQRTLMTLWCMARSPLIMGGDLRALDEATLDLLCNDEMLAINQASRNNRQVSRTADDAVWAAQDQRSGDTYIAAFNLRDSVGTSPVPVPLTGLGLHGPVNVRDLWAHTPVAQSGAIFAPEGSGHGACCFRITQG